MFKTFFTSEFKIRDSLVWFLLAGILFVLDIGSRAVLFNRSWSVLPGLGVQGFANYHFAFSIVLPESIMYSVYVGVICLVGYNVWKIWKNLTVVERISWVLIICGALVNVFERLYLGYVRDFLQVGTGYMNLGDIYIIVGVVFLLYKNVVVSKTSL